MPIRRLVLAGLSLLVAGTAYAQPSGRRGPPSGSPSRPPQDRSWQDRPPQSRPPARGPIGLYGSPGIAPPRPMGPAVPTPTPIGGLRTRPLGSPPDAYTRGGEFYDRDFRSGDRRSDDYRRRGIRPGIRYGNGYGYGYGYGYGTTYGVADAPLPRGGIVYGPHGEVRSVPAQTWFSTGDRPRWRVDSSLSPVQAWRDLIVTDVVCDGYGTCMEREQRVRAPWVPVCRCYLFTDALGRRWEVADR